MSHAAAESKTPVSVITGFLGSGKTTLLNALLRHPRMAETAVLVNEFGEIGIDHLLFETLDDDVLLLAAGCLCCTIREDMLASLRSLFERRAGGQVPRFRRVVIETTGLADPAPILHTLLAGESAPAPWIVDGIVTTVDAVNGNRQLSAYSESVKQAAVADRLLVTKTDVARRHELATLRERLRAINPGAPLLTACHGAIDPDDLFDAGPLSTRGGRHPDVSGWLGDTALAHGHRHRGAGSHDEGVRALCLSADAPIEIYRFVRWVEKLLEESGDRILRVKGILDVAGDPQPVVVHGVQHIFHPPREADRLVRLGPAFASRRDREGSRHRSDRAGVSRPCDTRCRAMTRPLKACRAARSRASPERAADGGTGCLRETPDAAVPPARRSVRRCSPPPPR